MTPTDELLPCPFCGGNKARTIHIRDGRKVACPCGACGRPEFHGPLDRPGVEARAITAWNTRTANERIAALEAKLAVAEGLLLSGVTACRTMAFFPELAVKMLKFLSTIKEPTNGTD